MPPWLLSAMYEPVSTLSAIVCRNTSTPSTSAILHGQGSLAKNLAVNGDSVMKHAHLLRLPLNVRMDKRDMVVGTYDVPQRRQPLFYPLYLDLVRYRISQVLQLLVCRRSRDEKALSVAGKC